MGVLRIILILLASSLLLTLGGYGFKNKPLKIAGLVLAVIFASLFMLVLYAIILAYAGYE